MTTDPKSKLTESAPELIKEWERFKKQVEHGLGYAPLPPEIRSSEWVDALAKKWERRIFYEGQVNTASVRVIIERVLRECITELRSESESASTQQIYENGK